jgi:hypothetical protein
MQARYETTQGVLGRALVVSLLLHALLLAAFRERAALHPQMSASTHTLEARLRPDERRELSTGGARVEATHATQSRRTRRAARKPAPEAAQPLAAPRAATEPAGPTEARPGPSREDQDAPLIDLEAATRIGREADRARERSLSELPGLGPPPSDTRVALNRGIAAAARADCRTAHAGKGLLAIPFLIFDAISGDGCKW